MLTQFMSIRLILGRFIPANRQGPKHLPSSCVHKKIPFGDDKSALSGGQKISDNEAAKQPLIALNIKCEFQISGWVRSSLHKNKKAGKIPCLFDCKSTLGEETMQMPIFGPGRSCGPNCFFDLHASPHKRTHRVLRSLFALS